MVYGSICLRPAIGSASDDFFDLLQIICKIYPLLTFFRGKPFSYHMVRVFNS